MKDRKLAGWLPSSPTYSSVLKVTTFPERQALLAMAIDELLEKGQAGFAGDQAEHHRAAEDGALADQLGDVRPRRGRRRNLDFRKFENGREVSWQWILSGSVFDFDDQIDLHRDIERQRRHAERGAGVFSLVAEDLDEQLGRAVDDLRVAGESPARN